MVELEFERRLERLFADAPAFSDEKAFATSVERKLDRGWNLRRILIGAAGLVGGLVGAMMTRGFEHELANHYDQAVVEGKILVAAQVDNDPSRIAAADRILEQDHRIAMPIREG